MCVKHNWVSSKDVIKRLTDDIRPKINSAPLDYSLAGQITNLLGLIIFVKMDDYGLLVWGEKKKSHCDSRFCMNISFNLFFILQLNRNIGRTDCVYQRKEKSLLIQTRYTDEICGKNERETGNETVICWAQ